MKKLLLIAALAAAGYFAYDRHASTPDPAQSSEAAATDSIDADASGTQVHGEGVVSRILSDDDDGSRHQRFILELSSGQTILVAHNIDLAPRIDDLEEGDTVEYSGEYRSNPQGGVVHWTHRDPSGRHVAGWLRHGGRLYQ
jgi:hypothetical protein